MTSLIVYEGASALDGKPVVAVLTQGSANRKTGAMAQLWILRADVEPHVAVKTGEDVSVCGDCVHRGVNGKGRTCYVLTHNAPLSIYRAYRRGSYAQATPETLRAATEGARVRLGAYGDPLALPLDVLEEVIKHAAGYTGYSHQWRGRKGDARAARLVMASVETSEQALEATAAGYRYFRARDVGEEVPGNEIDCPSERGIQCADCGLCAGTKRAAARSVSIELHGGTAVMANALKRGLITTVNV